MDARTTLQLHEDPPPLPDRAARERVEADLDTNLLLEAGAGSGKTTALVSRMVALVRTGTASAREIAAVTFTRKAAAELRERFQNALEDAVRKETGEAALGRLRDGLQEIDQAFIGTIHAFCAHLLRERPIEAGLDPGFEEMLEAENARLMKRHWTAFVERMVSDEDPALEELAGLGLAVHRLEGAYRDVAENLDVEFPAEDPASLDPSDLAEVRNALDGLLDRARTLLPRREPQKGWDRLQQEVRKALFRRGDGWRDEHALIEVVEDFCGKSSWGVTQYKWEGDGGGRGARAAAKQLGEDFTAFVAEDGPARRLLVRWYAVRYAPVVRLVRRAAEAFAEYRLRTGRLSFQDLLIQTARLLRTSPRARRDLGTRFRRILIDEFQDTDPIQAEVAFLLASDPDADPRTDAPWWEMVPRPGALFVVGDPKQSIYRFRRADIGIYNQVKALFRSFGDALELVANFRSLPDIGRIVNDVFGVDGRFPAAETPHQAPFAPLRPQRPEGPEGAGVYVYDVAASNKDELIERDAALLAHWIAGRVEAGERAPGDFMILTRTKPGLDRYARALEDRGLPVDVAGAGVGYQEVIRELMALLEALLDPGNDLLVVRALMGLFFGLDPESLLDHRLGGGHWSFTDRPEATETPVHGALACLHDWWQESRVLPADVLIEGLVAELGLFPHAAAGDLGSLRTGALAYALDAVRAQAVAGDTSLLGALEALEGAIEWDDAEAPLEPGRTDAVRVMNLHKAKGLEAAVVILAQPAGKPNVGRRNLKVEREPGRGPRGWLAIQEVTGTGFRAKVRTLAAPTSWEGRRADEIVYEDAEEDRLLYVAATRARDELVVARGGSGGSRSPWEFLEGWLGEHARLLEMEVGPPQERARLERSADDVLDRVRAVDLDRAERGREGYRFHTVTDLAKGAEDGSDASPPEEEGAEPADRTAPRGYEWGSVVHAALAVALRGLDGDALRAVCAALLVEYDRPTDDVGVPTELDALLGLVDRVRSSDLWRRAAAAGERHPEVPFATHRPGAAGAVPEMVEGVIDLVFLEDGGWVVADYKTDVGDDPDFPRRRLAYRRQVDLYAECWAALTGDPVTERVLLFTAQGREERW